VTVRLGHHKELERTPEQTAATATPAANAAHLAGLLSEQPHPPAG
jgi:hypothetical protein